MAQGKILTFATRKGGSGKSTNSMNLARALQLAGRKVQLVDLDIDNQSVTKWYNNWLARHSELPEIPEAPLPPTTLISGTDVRAALIDLAKVNDIVVVDAGAGSPRQNQSALLVTDLLLVPLSPSHMDMQSSFDFLHEIVRQQSRNAGRPAARVVLNRAEGKKKSAKDLVNMFVNGEVPVGPLSTIVPARESLSKMVSAGVTAFDFPHACDLRPIYQEMAAEVIEILDALPTVAA